MKDPILLIFPKHSPFPHSVEIPLATFTLGNYLSKQGFEVIYFDERVEKKSVLKTYLKQELLFVGLSCMTSYQITSAVRLAKLTRKYNKVVPLVFGGVHPSMLPEQTAESELVDFVVFGEGEKTITELATALNRNQDSFENIKGLVWKNEGEIIKNEPREFMDYNEVPSPINPETEKFLHNYFKRDEKITARQPFIYISSRGCPNNCAFCYNHYYHKNKWRGRDINIIRKELEQIKNLGVKNVFFSDDNMAGKLSHLEGIYNLTRELNLKWCGCITINLINQELVKNLEESGCEYLLFGLESASPKILKSINKHTTNEQMKKGIDLLADSPIIPMYSFIFGFPNETEEDRKQTFDLIDYIIEKDQKAEIQLQVYTPFPGTDLYKYALENGFKEPQKLEEWADMVMDEVHVPWVNKKDRKLLRNLYVISVFAFRNKEFFKSKIFYIPHKIALWRWKHKFFKFSYERLLYDIVKLLPWVN